MYLLPALGPPHQFVYQNLFSPLYRTKQNFFHFHEKSIPPPLNPITGAVVPLQGKLSPECQAEFWGGIPLSLAPCTFTKCVDKPTDFPQNPAPQPSGKTGLQDQLWQELASPQLANFIPQGSL